MLVKQFKVYKNNNLIGTYSAKEVEKLTGCNRNSIANYENSGSTYNHEYTFEYVGKGESDKMFDTLAQDWNEIRKCAKLIASGQAVIRQIGNEKYTCRRGKAI